MKNILFLVLLLPALGVAAPAGISGGGSKVGEGSFIDRSNTDSTYYRTDEERSQDARKQNFYNQSELRNKSTLRNTSTLGNDTLNRQEIKQENK